MSWEGMNRRQFPRANFPCMLKLVAAGNEKNAMLTHTENISTGGVCVILQSGLERFTPLDLELDLMDGDEHITCKGRVVWAVRRKATETTKPSAYDIGVEFVDLSEEARRHLALAVDIITRNERRAVL